MKLGLLARILWRRRQLRGHEQCSRDRLLAFQSRRLEELRRFTIERSPYYRRIHQGLEDKPLNQLPVVTKSELMAHFDEAVTDGAVRFDGVARHVSSMTRDEQYLGRYWVSATSGSSGRRGIFLWDDDEWTWVLASYSRTYEWSGIQVGLLRRKKLAVVSSRVPWHQSALVGASVKSRFVPTLRLDSTDPMEQNVQRLNTFQPDSLVGYASILDLLAAEQLDGKLRIQPQTVISASEVLTESARRRIEGAWGKHPFNAYAATETASIASDCEYHGGLHLYEDLVITEVVDEKNRLVPPGTTGAKVLVTVLFSRTLPLIRYEMSDRVTGSGERCPCGRPFALIRGVEGRAEDYLVLRSDSGEAMPIAPNVFHRILEERAPEGWQVVHRAEILEVRIVGKRLEIERKEIKSGLEVELKKRGVTPPRIVVTPVEAAERGATGKVRLIVNETQ